MPKQLSGGVITTTITNNNLRISGDVELANVTAAASSAVSKTNIITKNTNESVAHENDNKSNNNNSNVSTATATPRTTTPAVDNKELSKREQPVASSSGVQLSIQ